MKNSSHLLGLSALTLSLLSACATQGYGNLSVHQALFYGANTDTVTWVYGSAASTQSSGAPSSNLKLGSQAVTLRPQVAGTLATPGSLSIDGAPVLKGKTSGQTLNRVSVTQSGNSYTVRALADLESVYLSSGSQWYKLSGRMNAGQTVTAVATPNTFLRGAGNLSADEADVLGRELLGQGVLAVAVLPNAAIPDAAPVTEPALPDGALTRTALYLQSGVARSAAAPETAPSGSATPPVSAPPTGGAVAQGSVTFRQIAQGNNAATTDAQVIVGRTAGQIQGIAALGYGRQTGSAALGAASGSTVVGIFLGQRPTGGYGVSVRSVRGVGSTLEVTVNVTAPGAGSITTQALTSPWIAVEVPGSYSSVVVRDQNGNRLN